MVSTIKTTLNVNSVLSFVLLTLITIVGVFGKSWFEKVDTFMTTSAPKIARLEAENTNRWDEVLRRLDRIEKKQDKSLKDD